MSTDHVHHRRAASTGDEPVRAQASGHADHGGLVMLAMLACCVAIGLVVLLVAFGVF